MGHQPQRTVLAPLVSLASVELMLPQVLNHLWLEQHHKHTRLQGRALVVLVLPQVAVEEERVEGQQLGSGCCPLSPRAPRLLAVPGLEVQVRGLPERGQGVSIQVPGH